jgi:hypothetical protein
MPWINVKVLSTTTAINNNNNNNKTKFRGLLRKRTIPTERPPFVGEVSANF